MRITLGNTLPPYPDFVEGIRRAPDRGYTLTPAQTITALKNALRYIPTEWHEQLAPELMEELRTRGRIYGYRWLSLKPWGIALKFLFLHHENILFPND